MGPGALRAGLRLVRPAVQLGRGAPLPVTEAPLPLLQAIADLPEAALHRGLAHREAVVYFEHALSALSHLPETHDTSTLAIDLRLALRTALRLLAARALEHARTYEERGNEAYALRLLGDIAAHRDPPEVEEAEVHYCMALALATELGMCPLAAHGHLGLGTLYAKIGRREHAHPELSTAIDLYRAVEMAFWLSQAGPALAQVEGR